MDGSSNLVRCKRRRTSQLVRCKRRRTSQRLKSRDYFESIPYEILMLILVRVPAETIFCVAMVVCRKWHQMIHTREFVFAHLNYSTPGLLLVNVRNPRSYFMSMSTTHANQVEVFDFDYSLKFKEQPTFWSICNGLLLEVDINYDLVITNPVTRKHFPLPPFIDQNRVHYLSSVIAFAPTQMEHKVVQAYKKRDLHNINRLYCVILTFGVDNSWRHVDTKHLSLADSIELDTRCPLATEGFVHWAEDYCSISSLEKTRIITEKNNDYVWTLNVETETIARISVPECRGRWYYYKYFSGGSCLSLLIGRGYLKWEVWEMKPKTGDWTKLPDIDLEAYQGFINRSCDRDRRSIVTADDGDCWDCKLCPTGWLKYPEVILFVGYVPIKDGDYGQAKFQFAYNVQTQDKLNFMLEHHHHPYLVHTNSLVGINLDCSPRDINLLSD